MPRRNRNLKSPQQASRWSREQKQKKRRSFFLFFRPAIIFILFFLLVFLGFSIYKQIRSGRWDGHHNFNLTILVSTKIYVISYHPTSAALNILEIPSQTYLPLSHDFGEYPASSIWPLGEQEKIGGGLLLQTSCQYFLAVPMQGWGKVNKNPPTGGQNEKLNKNDLLSLIINLAKTRERNLTLWDLTRLAWAVNQLPPNAINFYSLEQTRAGDEVILPDGSQVFRIQKEFLEKLSGELFTDNDFLQEAIIWGVVNQTDFPGIAGQTAKMINNIGGEVGFFEDRNQEKKEGIYCDQEKICQSYSAFLLSQTLRLPIIKESLEQARAEAIIVLGEEHRRLFYSR